MFRFPTRHNHGSFVHLTTLLALMLVLGASSTAFCAQSLPAHCEDVDTRDALRRNGPIISVGASASGGIFSKSFPTLVANQLCLSDGAGFESRHSVSAASKFPFLKKMFIEQRPKIVLALDHLHHSSKNRRFNAQTRAYLDEEIAMLTLDCNHALIDCSPSGEFAFVKKEHYRPVVLLGDIYAFYAVDCTKNDAYFNADIHDKNVGCLEDYDKINQYLRQKAAENPNLLIFPVNDFYRNLHRGLPFLYELNGRIGNFYAKDLFWDGFHPRSAPGAQVLANLIIARLNALAQSSATPSRVTIPTVPLDDRCFTPFTGVVLTGDAAQPMRHTGNLRFVATGGAPFSVVFAERARATRAQQGGWAYTKSYDRTANPHTERVGANPLIIRMARIAENGDIVLANEQHALLQKVSRDPQHELLGGLITDIK